MKKRRLVALALAAGIMLMGAGYAQWNDNITVKTTVETGELEVELQCSCADAYVYENATEIWRYYSGNEEYYDNIKVSTPIIKGDTVTFGFENLFPGSAAVAKLYIKNTGTMPAVLQGIKVDPKTIDSYDGKAELLEVVLVDYRFRVKDSEGNVVPGYKFSGENVPLKDLQRELDTQLKGIELLPDYVFTSDWDETDTMHDKFVFKIPHGSLKGDQGEKEIINVAIDFNFVQHNMFK